MRNKFAIIGLGSFGGTVAEELERIGNEVLGVDKDEHRVNRLADRLSHVVIADARDENVLQDLGLKDYDGVVVAIGEDLEANVLATLALKQMGVRCVWVKALTPSHHRILVRLGADRIINPEHEIGVQVAQTLTYPYVIDYIALGNDYYIVELDVPARIEGRPLPELRLTDYALRFLVLKRGAEPLQDDSSSIVLQRCDRLVLMGHLDQLRRFGREQL